MIAVPVPNLESDRHRPASGLSVALRGLGRVLATRSLLVLEADSRAKSAAGLHCNGVAIARSAPGLRGAL